ncbi:hypothetical protein AB0K51_33765 [Kitasatospora sp. NPDC049285]|uniref:hypothetical protein n=1 Tax=Kitasatospora sp. NPDC049285 TaxID=3157096 RepID=UPI0034256050
MRRRRSAGRAPSTPEERHQAAAEIARLLDRHFAEATAEPSELFGLAADRYLATFSIQGPSFGDYPHTTAVLDTQLSWLARLGPSVERFRSAAYLAATLSNGAQWEPWRAQCEGLLALLDRDDWVAAARSALRAGDPRIRQLAEFSSYRRWFRALRDA